VRGAIAFKHVPHGKKPRLPQKQLKSWSLVWQPGCLKRVV